MRKIKIVYCIPALYYPSGMERVLTLKANYLATNGYEIHIVITDGGNKNPYFQLHPSIKLHQLDIDFEAPYRHIFIKRLWLYWLKMRTFRKKLDVCLCQIKPDITVSLLRRDINIINKMTDGSIKVGEIHFDRLHYRNFTVSWMPLFIYSFIQRHWMQSLIKELRKLATFVVLTNEDSGYWPELDNVKVISNPASFFPDEVSDCMSKQVVAAGRLVGQKGFERLIAAWEKVADKHPDWVLKIYGDGWMHEQLQTQIEELQLQRNCFLKNTVPNIAEKFQKSSIFVLSSRYEGMAMVIAEAMACGVPVVSFACHCGPRDIISEGLDGFLVEEGDINGLAEKINLLIENDELRKEMGKMARQKASEYKIDRIGAKWEALFKSLVKG